MAEHRVVPEPRKPMARRTKYMIAGAAVALGLLGSGSAIAVAALDATSTPLQPCSQSDDGTNRTIICPDAGTTTVATETATVPGPTTTVPGPTTTVPGPTTTVTVTNTGAPTTTASSTTAPPPPPTSTASTTSATPPPGGVAGASNTGYANASCPNGRTTHTGSIVSGATYSCQNFGVTFVNASNVTFYGDDFKGADPQDYLVAVAGTNDSFNYSTFEPAGSGASNAYEYGIAENGAGGSHGPGLKVDHSNFFGFGNAIDETGSTAADPDIFTNDWVHDPCLCNGYHNDGIGNESQSNGEDTGVQMINDTIADTGGNTNAIAYQAGTYHGFVVENCHLSGGTYTVSIWDNGSTNITFENNQYLGGAVYGPTYPQNFWSGPGDVWSGNILANGSVWNPPTGGNSSP